MAIVAAHAVGIQDMVSYVDQHSLLDSPVKGMIGVNVKMAD